jgi:BirA family transcriptional regulator, biotin operon repressor / biotin---[acetyl-CoA-carboxylase] ligase
VAGERLVEGDWLITDRQTAGRGRLGRAWQDGAGNFMGSTVVQAGAGDPPAHSLALLLALAVRAALIAAGVTAPLLIKWPNDLLCDGAKVAGILLERHGDQVVVGVGVNLVSAPDLPDRATTSLAVHGHALDRDDFARQLATALMDGLARWRGGDWPGTILDQWLAAAHPIGTPLTLTEGPSAGLTGAFDGLERNGSLRLRARDGAVTIIHAGEVRLSTPDGYRTARNDNREG